MVSPFAPTWPASFQETFCKHFGCPPEQFTRRAFRRCLYWRARLLAPVIGLLRPSFFTPDLDFIARVGQARSWAEFSGELQDFSHTNRHGRGGTRGSLRLRVSGRNARRLAAELFPPRRPPEPGPPKPATSKQARIG
jgi:hypothetical protein